MKKKWHGTASLIVMICSQERKEIDRSRGWKAVESCKKLRTALQPPQLSQWKNEARGRLYNDGNFYSWTEVLRCKDMSSKNPGLPSGWQCESEAKTADHHEP